MKFSAKNSDALRGLQPALACSTTGTKREYPDVGRITIAATDGGLVSSTNNGNVALTNANSGGDSYQFITAGSVTIKTSDLTNVLNSFPSEEVLTFELEGTELVIRPTDAEQFQTVPIEVREIIMVGLAEKFDKEVTIRKEVLMNSLKKVSFAVGFEKFKTEFLYSCLRISPNRIRSVAGDGARFAVYEIEGDNIVDTKKALDVVIHRDHMPVLEKLLSAIGGESITIQEYARGRDDDSLTNQTVFSGNGLSLALIGHDPGVKWPDENRFLDRVNTFKMVVPVADFGTALKGILATNNDDVTKANEYHYASLNFDLTKKVSSMAASHALRANRKFALADTVGPESTIDFKVLSQYLSDLTKHAPSPLAQFEFVDSKSACIVKFFAGTSVKDSKIPSENVSTGTKEQYTIFFSAFNKKTK